MRQSELKRPELPVPALAVPAERAPWIGRESLEPALRLETPRPQQQTAPQGDLPPPLPPPLDTGDFESHMKPDASIGPRGIEASEEPSPGANSPAREPRIVPMPIDRIASASPHQQPAVATDERTMAPFWALRPGVAPDPIPASLNETHGRGDGQKNGAGDLKPERTNVFQVIDMDEPTVPYLRLARPPAAEAVDGPELEAMQKLIQQLATQLNGPREEAPEQPKTTIQQPEVKAEDVHPSEPTVAQSVATSVAALRATAETMRGKYLFSASLKNCDAAATSARARAGRRRFSVRFPSTGHAGKGRLVTTQAGAG